MRRRDLSLRAVAQRLKNESRKDAEECDEET